MVPDPPRHLGTLASANDYYSLRVAAAVGASLRRLLAVLLQLLLLYLATFFLSPPGSLPRRFIAYYAILSLVLVGLWRACRIFLLGWSGFRRRVLVVGGGHASDMIREVIAFEAPDDYEVVGLVTSVHDLSLLAGGEDDLPTVTGRDLPALAQRLGASDVILAYASEVPDDVFDGLMRAYEQGANVVPMPVLYEQITGRMPIEQVGDVLWPLVLPLEKRTVGFMLYLMGKRLIDLALACIGLTLFAVLLPLLALAIKLDSRGPIFYQQERLGQAGHAFHVFKLRSMRADAEGVSGPCCGAIVRPTCDPCWPRAAQDTARRAAPARQRLEGRDEHRRTATGAPGVRATARGGDPFLSHAAGGETGTDRLGAGLLPLRQLDRGCAAQAAI